MAARTVKGTSPGTRLQLGASVLIAARGVDTSAVKGRLVRFEKAHRSYVSSQQKVDTAEAQLRAAQMRLAELDAVQDQAVDVLARELIHAGQPPQNAFAAFDAPPPRTLMRLAFPKAAEAVHQLVAAVLRSKGMSEAATQAAQAADKAALAMEEALAPVAKLQDTVRDARRLRDAVGQEWESALAALRLVARAAAAEGAPDLHATLFGTVSRTAKPKASAQPAPTDPPAATPNAA